jgi:hypothetical protein
MGYQEIKRSIVTSKDLLSTILIHEKDALEFKEEEILDLLLLNKTIGYRIQIRLDDHWISTPKEYFKPVYYKYRLLLE